MAWRAVVISNPARLRVELDRLIIAQEEEVALPLEDLCAVVLESPAITLSAALLARFGQHDILLLVCDEKHLPCAALLPFAGHSRLLRQQRLQLETSLPFRKRCWQIVVRQKIANQAECLRLLKRPGADDLAALVAEVTSGDGTQVEGQAARIYFQHLFGKGFTREAECPVNSALNYGYAIVRGAIARALAAHGFLPALGIHHCNELNPFNLADDFIEPFRPLVDLAVAAMKLPADGLGKEERSTLASLLRCDLLVEGERHPVLHAAELAASSFVSACAAKEPTRLRLPSLLPVTTHAYE